MSSFTRYSPPNCYYENIILRAHVQGHLGKSTINQAIKCESTADSKNRPRTALYNLNSSPATQMRKTNLRFISTILFKPESKPNASQTKFIKINNFSAKN